MNKDIAAELGCTRRTVGMWRNRFKSRRRTPRDGPRGLAKVLGCSDILVRRVWYDHGIKPHRTKGFKVSNDPRFAEKVVDVFGL